MPVNYYYLAKMKNMFVIILSYVVPIDTIDQHRADHIRFLDEYYARGLFIVSGRQTSTRGGVILAMASSMHDIEKIIDEDPFKMRGLAEYQVFEFTPSKYSEAFANVIPETMAG